MKRLLPYPLLFLALLAMWLLLAGSLATGQVLLGVIVSLLACWAVVAVEPPKPRIRFGAILGLSGRLVVDIVRSNIAVIVLIVSGRPPHSMFVRVPLTLREPNGLALLAGIVTATPGSAWIDYDAARSEVTIHVLHVPDDAAWIAALKRDYESRLLEIFQ